MRLWKRRINDDNEDVTVYLYYNKVHYDIEDKLEEMRARIIYHCEKDKIEYESQLSVTHLKT